MEAPAVERGELSDRCPASRRNGFASNQQGTPRLWNSQRPSHAQPACQSASQPSRSLTQGSSPRGRCAASSSRRTFGRRASCVRLRDEARLPDTLVSDAVSTHAPGADAADGLLSGVPGSPAVQRSSGPAEHGVQHDDATLPACCARACVVGSLAPVRGKPATGHVDGRSTQPAGLDDPARPEGFGFGLRAGLRRARETRCARYARPGWCVAGLAAGPTDGSSDAVSRLGWRVRDRAAPLRPRRHPGSTSP